MSSAEENHDSSDEEEGGEIQLEMVELTIGTLDLRESEIYLPRHRRRRRRKKEETKPQNEGRSGPPHRWPYLHYKNLRNAHLSHKRSASFMKFLVHV